MQKKKKNPVIVGNFSLVVGILWGNWKMGQKI